MKEASHRNSGWPSLCEPPKPTFAAIVERADVVLAGSRVSSARSAGVPGETQPGLPRPDAGPLDSVLRDGDLTAQGLTRGSSFLGRESGLPILTGAGRPGGLAEIEVPLVSDGAEPVTVGLVATDLVSASNGRIPSSCILPDPIALELLPGRRTSLRVVTTVPAATSSGLYSGLVQVTGQPQARAVLSLKVE